MRIGIIVDNEFNNDIRVRNEALALQKEGHNVFVLCFEYGSNFGSEYKGINIHRWKIDQKKKNILFALFHSFNIYSSLWAKRIRRFIDQENIDIIHVHDLYMSKAGYLGKQKSKIPMVLDLHENYTYAVEGYQWMYKKYTTHIIKPNRWKKIEERYLNYADTIITISSTFKNYLLEKYNSLDTNNIIVYPNAPDVKTLLSYKIDHNIIPKSNDFALFYFGVVSKRRGIFLVLDALETLVKDIPNIKFLIIGPVDKSEKSLFEQRINKPIIKDNIIYYPWKDISLLPSFINYSNVCLSPIEKNPQHESGIANKVFQYMLFERPVLVSNCGPQADVINESNAGLVHQWDSTEDFSKKINYLFQNKEIAVKMGKNGKEAVYHKYNQSELIKPLLNLYK